MEIFPQFWLKFEKPGRRDDFDYPEMSKESVGLALADANISYDKVEQAVVGYVYGDSACGQRALYQVQNSSFNPEHTNLLIYHEFRWDWPESRFTMWTTTAPRGLQPYSWLTSWLQVAWLTAYSPWDLRKCKKDPWLRRFIFSNWPTQKVAQV